MVNNDVKQTGCSLTDAGDELCCNSDIDRKSLRLLIACGLMSSYTNRPCSRCLRRDDFMR